MPLTPYDAEDHAGALERLLPRGRIWILDRAKQLWALLTGFGDELARIDGRGIDLVEESDPRTTDELLPDWERFAGLPDPCAPVPVTKADRRLALEARLTAVGGQSKAYFIARAAAMGIVVTITIWPFGLPFRMGTSRIGQPLNGTAAIYHWLVDGPAATSADDRERLICLFDRLEPSHTIRSHTWTA